MVRERERDKDTERERGREPAKARVGRLDSRFF